jgi:hypothetical protein
MASQTTLFVIAFSIASILITALIAGTLVRFIIKENEDTNIQDVIGVIQAITGIIGVPLGILSIALYLIDKCIQSRSRPMRDAETGQLLPSLNCQYNGGLVENAKAHIKHMCDIQQQRYRVFQLNEATISHFPTDLVKMKYDRNASNIDGSKWVEDPSDKRRLSSEQIMQMINEQANTPLNLLIEVSFIKS